jgi:flagellar basal-body rod protein FlgG
MVVQMHHLDAVANNLANVDMSGYKRDTPVDKAFPEILLRRMNDDGVYRFPLGSVDTTPIVGRLGTGVELNEVFTVFEQGPLKQTENPFDPALEGAGFLSIVTEAGERYTRNGNFRVDANNTLVDASGAPVAGAQGPLILPPGKVSVGENGAVRVDGLPAGNMRLRRFVSTDVLQRADHGDFVLRPGTSAAEAPPTARVRQGCVERSNAAPLDEMVRMLSVVRSFEAAQRVARLQSETLGRVVNELIQR